MNRILALDTAGLDQTVAVLDEGRIAGSATWRRSHPDLPFMARLESVMRQAQLDPKSLTAVVAGCGPGSFTGLRVGLAAAAGMAFALGIDLYLINSLEVLAARMVSSTGALRDAGRAEFYVWRKDAPTSRISLEALHSWLRANDQLVVEPAGALQRWVPERAALEASLKQQSSAVKALTECASAAVRRQRPVLYHEVEPLYAQPAAAEEREVNRK